MIDGIDKYGVGNSIGDIAHRLYYSLAEIVVAKNEELKNGGSLIESKCMS